MGIFLRGLRALGAMPTLAVDMLWRRNMLSVSLWLAYQEHGTPK